METVLEPDYADPSYNGYVVPESIELATALDQYWLERRTRYEQSLERHREHAEDPAAEREWLRFCSGGTGFLKKYTKKAVASLGSPLRHLWTNGAGIAREAQNIIETGASTEIWIPFSLTPLKFVCLGQRSPVAKIRQLPHSDRSESFALGKPHMMIRCGDTYLFMVLPTGVYATLNAFAFTKEGVSWNTQEVLPKMFAEALPEFRPYLAAAERLFAPIHASWDAKEQITRGTRYLSVSRVVWKHGGECRSPTRRSSIYCAEWSCLKPMIQQPLTGCCSPGRPGPGSRSSPGPSQKPQAATFRSYLSQTSSKRTLERVGDASAKSGIMRGAIDQQSSSSMSATACLGAVAQRKAM